MKKLLLLTLTCLSPILLQAMEEKKSNKILYNRNTQRTEREVSVQLNPIFGIDSEDKINLLKQLRKDRIRKLARKDNLQALEEFKRSSREFIKRLSQDGSDFTLVKMDKGSLEEQSQHIEGYSACCYAQHLLAKADNPTAKYFKKRLEDLRTKKVGNQGTLGENGEQNSIKEKNGSKSPRRRVTAIKHRFQRKASAPLAPNNGTTTLSDAKKEAKEKDFAF